MVFTVYFSATNRFPDTLWLLSAVCHWSLHRHNCTKPGILTGARHSCMPKYWQHLNYHENKNGCFYIFMVYVGQVKSFPILTNRYYFAIIQLITNMKKLFRKIKMFFSVMFLMSGIIFFKKSSFAYISRKLDKAKFKNMFYCVLDISLNHSIKPENTVTSHSKCVFPPYFDKRYIWYNHVIIDIWINPSIATFRIYRYN